MAVRAIEPGYHGTVKDVEENFHGQMLLNIGWDQHLMFTAAHCIPLPPDMPFGALVAQVLPTIFGAHPDFARIDWARAQWRRDGEAFQPDPARSLRDNGLGHKSLLGLRTPGLEGLYGIGF